MNKLKSFTFLLLILSFFSCAKQKPATAGEAAQQVFDMIRLNDLQGLLKLKVTKAELTEVIGHLKLSDSISTAAAKAVMMRSLDESVERSEATIKLKLEAVSKDLQEKQCAESIALVKKEQVANTLSNPGIDSYTAAIQYNCNNDLKTIYVELINTTDGWKLDAIR